MSMDLSEYHKIVVHWQKYVQVYSIWFNIALIEQPLNHYHAMQYNRIITEDTKTLLLLQPNVDWLSSLGMCGPSYYHFCL